MALIRDAPVRMTMVRLGVMKDPCDDIGYGELYELSSTLLEFPGV